MNIGLIAMSAKPYHAGHDGLVRWAAEENDEVHLFVSLSDRKRPGELSILGKDMERIWKTQIEGSLPENVHIHYGGAPVANIYKELIAANDEGSEDTFVIYSDPTDIAKSYPESSLNKYAERLWNNQQIVLKPIDRSWTVDVSGTKMRQYLSSGNKKAFVANLPKSIDGDEVWNVLSKQKSNKIKGEAVLRKYIRMLF